MALRHVRAVQKNTKLDDPIARSIIQVIATDIGFDDSPAYPSYRTIAARAGCHYNTVADKVRALCDNGDLIVTKEGKYNYYSLPYPCDDFTPDYHSNRGDNVGPVITPQYVTKEELSHALSQFAAELSHALSQEMQALSQRSPGIVTLQGVTEEEGGEEGEEEKEEWEEDAHPLANGHTLDHSPTLPGANTDDFDEELAEMKAALAVVAREDAVFHEVKISAAAKALLRQGATPEFVDQHFGSDQANFWNTASYGRKGEKPYVSNIVGEYSQAVEWAARTNGRNGSGPYSDQIPEEYRDLIRR